MNAAAEPTGSVRVSKRRTARLRAGHLWVYDSDIEEISGEPADGDCVEVRDGHGRYVGRGYYNSRSQIQVRLMTRGREGLGADLFRRLIEEAVARRAEYVGDAEAYRVVHASGDLLPGLIVDRYRDVLVVQFTTLGIDLRKEMICDILEDRLSPTCIYERSDQQSRTLEGLPPRVGALRGAEPGPFWVTEHGLRFLVDVKGGKKTGLYLDQRENREVVGRLARCGRVLDCFTFRGGFALTSAKAGASEVIGVDSSEEDIATARGNARENDLADKCRFVTANAFDYLRQCEEDAEEFDLVVLDPPPFAKRKVNLGKAVRAYKEINLRAIKIARSGGHIVTFTCSHHLRPALFLRVVAEASADARRHVHLMEERTQSRDHPILLTMPESRYLTCLVLRVL